MYRIIALLLCFTGIIVAQVSINDINKLSNEQMDLLQRQLKSNNSDNSINEIEEIKPVLETVNIYASDDNSDISNVNYYFGYNYFKRDINFFDNIPSPPDFRLGPGDEIILSLWGETNSREKFFINKEGLIYYENIGFINLSNKTLKEAESVLLDELSRIYSTLKDKESSTKLMLELGQLKSINVHFSGQIENPGINLIHPFSDIFSAIVQAGGINKDGSLRKIQLIRSNKIIDIIDFYSFFRDGKNNFSNTRILDGDVIHIPETSIRAEIRGSIIREGFFELTDNETVFDLIRYAGGLSQDASSYGLLDTITPMSERSSDDNARVSTNISLKESKNIKINNGSRLKIIPIGNVETKVSIYGRVKLPGDYAASTLKQLLDIAGGFDDPLYRKTILDNEIIVLRKDKKQFYGTEFKISYSESNEFELIPGDKIFVYENTMYNNLSSISVIGEVNKRGSFQLKSGMTVRDAINLAGGFSPLANKEAITVTEVFSSVNNLGKTSETIKQVKDATFDFELTDGSVINVLQLENVVNVQGNVYSPGLVTFTKAKTVNKYINLAGGPKPNTLSSKIYVKRANGRIKKVTFFQGIGTIVKPGDTIVVPVDPNPSEFNITTFTADILAVFANLAAILVIIDNQND